MSQTNEEPVVEEPAVTQASPDPLASAPAWAREKYEQIQNDDEVVELTQADLARVEEPVAEVEPEVEEPEIEKKPKKAAAPKRRKRRRF